VRALVLCVSQSCGSLARRPSGSRVVARRVALRLQRRACRRSGREYAVVGEPEASNSVGEARGGGG